jgi:hypothetical protein
MPAPLSMIAHWQVWVLLLAAGLGAADNDVAGLRLVQWIRDVNGTVRLTQRGCCTASSCNIVLAGPAQLQHQCLIALSRQLCMQADVTVGAVPGTDGLRGVFAAREFASGEVVVSFPLKRAVGLGMATQTAQARMHSSRADTAAPETCTCSRQLLEACTAVLYVCCQQNTLCCRRQAHEPVQERRKRKCAPRAESVERARRGSRCGCCASARRSLTGGPTACPTGAPCRPSAACTARSAGARSTCRCCRTLPWCAERRPRACARGRAPRAPAAGSALVLINRTASQPTR